MNELTSIPRVPRPSRVSAYLAGQFGPPVIDRATVTDVLEGYGIRIAGPSRNLRLARRSLNVAVATPLGKRVVKLYRPQWKPSTVAYGHSILVQLEANEVPAVRLSRTSEGATYVTRQNRVFAVFDFVPGVNYSLNFLRRPDRLRLTVIAAETLTQLHRAGDFTPTGEHHVGLVSKSGPWRRDVAWHAAKLDELGSRSAKLREPEAHRRAQSLSDRSEWLLAQIAGLDAAMAGAELPRLVIHGDYGLHNLIFQPSGAIPVDFELSRMDLRINDLVSALGKYRYRSGHYDFESMYTFMRAYGRQFPLTADEKVLLPEIWRLYKLQAAVQYWNSYFETNGPIRKLDSALDAIEQSEWVTEHPEMIGRLAQAGAWRTMTVRRPLTALLVTPNLEIGGAQENLRTMARHLPTAGVRTVVCTFDDGPLRSEIEDLGVPVEVLPARRHSVLALPVFVLEMWRTHRALVALVDRHEIDVVQTYGLGTLDFLVATLRRSRRVQVWWTIENVHFMVRREHLGRHGWLLRPKRVVHRILYRTGARLVNGVIVVSDETVAAFREAVGYRGDNVRVVPNAVDVERNSATIDREGLRAQLGFAPTDHLMTMVGTFKRQKGHAVLLAAFAEIAERVPRLHVLLVGGGELADDMRAHVAAAGLTSRVHFLGSRRDVPALLAASDSFVLPSLWEGLPVALLEAMASALPVVATAVSGTRQVMVHGKTGWVVPAGDVDALANAMIELVSDPAQASAMGVAGRHRVVAHFGAPTQAERLAGLFGRVGPADVDVSQYTTGIEVAAR